MEKSCAGLPSCDRAFAKHLSLLWHFVRFSPGRPPICTLEHQRQQKRLKTIPLFDDFTFQIVDNHIPPDTDPPPSEPYHLALMPIGHRSLRCSILHQVVHE